MTTGERNGLMVAAGVGAFLAARAVLRSRPGYELQGKTALVTGGSRGLGLVLARQLHEQGCSLVICAREPAELERAREELAYRGADVLAVPCDLTKRDQVRNLVQAACGQFGAIDILINNAGVIEVGPFENMVEDDYREAMATHFWAPLFTILEVAPQMQARQEGRIVNISSIGGKIAIPHLVPYCASKFALVGLSEGLRAELLKDSVYVTTVVPGLMRTGSPRNAYFKGQNEAEYAWFSLLGSVPGSSISAERAARQIIEACRRGDAELVISLSAQMAVRLHGMFPGMTADILGAVNRVMPGPGGIGEARARGYESESRLSPSILTALNEIAAQRNNEMG